MISSNLKQKRDDSQYGSHPVFDTIFQITLKSKINTDTRQNR